MVRAGGLGEGGLLESGGGADDARAEMLGAGVAGRGGGRVAVAESGGRVGWQTGRGGREADSQPRYAVATANSITTHSWTSKSPRPPAAAWTRIFWPGLTSCASCTNVSAARGRWRETQQGPATRMPCGGGFTHQSVPARAQWRLSLWSCPGAAWPSGGPCQRSTRRTPRRPCTTVHGERREAQSQPTWFDRAPGRSEGPQRRAGRRHRARGTPTR